MLARVHILGGSARQWPAIRFVNIIYDVEAWIANLAMARLNCQWRLLLLLLIREVAELEMHS